MYQLCRQNSKEGGVAILVQEHITQREYPDLYIFDENTFESVFVETEIANKKCIVGEVYRVPNSLLDKFFEYYNRVLSNLNKGDCNIVGTDQNIDCLRILQHQRTEEFLELNLGP